jgi:uncharacterized HAD superfamily protein
MRDLIGLDLDSVLCNTEYALDKYLREELGVFLDWENEVDQYNIEELPRISPDQKEEIQELIHSGALFKDIYPYNYAEHATKKLRNEGFDIAIITSRSESLKDMTKDWLDQYDIVYDLFYTIHSFEKYEIIRDLNIKAFVEDRFDVLEIIIDRYKVLDYGLYIVNQPWNKRDHHEQVIRVDDVAQAVDKIVEYRKWLGYFTHRCQGNIEKFIKEYRDGKGAL